ncbi:MAG: amidase [Alphaproteobacteria bacterium]
MTEPCDLGALDAGAAIATGRLSSEALVRSCLDRIAARDPAIDAWSFLDPEQALAEARRRDAEAPRGPLHGVPVGVKDVIDTRGMPTAYGSPIYEGHVPHADAACVALLRAAGMVVLGKTVTTEFANRHPGKTRNPHDPGHTPGGSSSGSAAAVAAGMVPLAIGTQTGGSVIRPSAFCGVVGFKPTFGRVPRAGLKFLSESLDTIGVMARSVADAAAFASVLEGTPVAPLLDLEGPPRLGLCRGPAWPQIEPAGAAALDEAVRHIRKAGGVVREVILPRAFDDAPEAQMVIMAYEGARDLAAEREAHWDLLSPALRQAMIEGRSVTRQRYDWARSVQASCRATVVDIFARIDALMTPAAAGEAPAGLGSTGSAAFNRVWTLIGAPCVTVPGLTGPRGLPIGTQLVGLPGHAAATLACADWVQRRLAA